MNSAEVVILQSLVSDIESVFHTPWLHGYEGPETP